MSTNLPHYVTISGNFIVLKNLYYASMLIRDGFCKFDPCDNPIYQSVFILMTIYTFVPIILINKEDLTMSAICLYFLNILLAVIIHAIQNTLILFYIISISYKTGIYDMTLRNTINNINYIQGDGIDKSRTLIVDKFLSMHTLHFIVSKIHPCIIVLSILLHLFYYVVPSIICIVKLKLNLI